MEDDEETTIRKLTDKTPYVQCQLELDKKKNDSNVVTGVILEWDNAKGCLLDSDDDSILSSSSSSLSVERHQPHHQLLVSNSHEENNDRKLLEAVCNLHHIRKLRFIGCQSSSAETKNHMGHTISETLLELHFEDCNELRCLPKYIENLHVLQSLTIKSCSRLRTIGCLLPPNLQHLQISNNPSLASLPASAIRRLRTTLKSLSIEYCASLQNLPTNEIQRLYDLERLHMEGLHFLTSLPCLSGLRKLKHLEVQHCPNVIRFDNNLDGGDLSLLNNLEDITISGCPRLESLPIGLKSSRRLQRLNLSLLAPKTVLEFFDTPWPTAATPHAAANTTSGVAVTTTTQESIVTGPWTICLDGIMNEFSHDFSNVTDRQRSEVLGNDYRLILPGLPQSLKQLSVSGQGIDDLSGFLGQVPAANSEMKFEQRAGVRLPPGLTTLLLDDNPVLDRIQSGSDDDCNPMKDRYEQRRQDNLLKTILKTYPQLGRICSPEKMRRRYCLDDNVQHQLHMNRCGRILLQLEGGRESAGGGPKHNEIGACNNRVATPTKKPIPVSLWPIVLDQVKYQIDHRGFHYETLQMAASVLYSFLRHGQILINHHGGVPSSDDAADDDDDGGGPFISSFRLVPSKCGNNGTAGRGGRKRKTTGAA